jgi:hypothetical protein
VAVPVHDAPHRAEQAHVGAHRTDGGQRRQALLQPVDLLELRHAHGASRAVEQHLGRHAGLLPQSCKLAKPQLEDAFHAGGVGARLDGAVQVGEFAAGPEGILEPVGVGARAAQQMPLGEDDGPGDHRRPQQQGNDELHDPARMQHQADHRQLLLHQLSSLRSAGGRRRG